MDQNISLPNDERIILTLRSLYAKYGYRPYRMSKFEEYDLYVRNKDFLVSDSVLTFTDRDGRLRALKPDVTLSIIKNTRDCGGALKRLCYDENVYRVPKGSRSFREQMQVGLELIGALDLCGVSEVLWLAAESLASLEPDFVLDVSHLGFAEAAAALLPAGKARDAFLKCIADKNFHEAAALADEYAPDSALTDSVRALTSLSGPAPEVLAAAKALGGKLGCPEAARELETVLSVFADTPFADRVRLDLSVFGDMNYYNGIVFRGFLRDVAAPVLSGGQYDRLMRKMRRTDRAAGFAVFLDLLERLNETAPRPDADVLLLYPASAAPAELRRAVDSLRAEGLSVYAAREEDAAVSCLRTAELSRGEVIFRD